MSDEELLKIVGSSQSTSTPELTSISDDELMKIAGVSSTPVSGYQSDLTKKMSTELSIKDKAIADAKELKKTNPAAGDQALRDAMRLGIATSGEVSSDVKQVTEFVGEQGTAAKTYEGKTIGLGDVAEPGMVDFTVDLLTSTPTGKVIGAGALGATGLGVYSAVKSSLATTSKGTDYLIRRIVAGLPEEEAVAKTDEIISLVKSIPKDQQAYALANMAEGKMGFDNIKKAITNASNDTKLEAILNNTLTDRRQIVTAVTAGNADVGAAQVKWTEMLDKVNEVSPSQFSTKSLQNSLDYVSNIYGLEGTSKASQIVRQIKADTAEPALSASQALNVRKGINELIRKAPQGSREITELQKIKTSLDNFIETTLPPEVNQLVKDTTAEYSRVINNRKFTDIINKNTSQGIGVDWSKVIKDAKKEQLHSEEVTIATNIAKAFESKFKYDKQLSSVAAPKGVDEASGGLMFFLTQVSNKVRDIASPLYNRTRYENLKIQKEIVKAIEQKGTSFTETLTGLAKNKNIPEEYRLGVFQKLADEFSPNELKPEHTFNDILDVNSRANSESVLKPGAKATASTTSDKIDEAISISEQTGKSVDEVVTELNSKQFPAAPEGQSEFVTNLLAGKPEQLRTYDETISELQAQGFTLGSRRNIDGSKSNFAIKDGNVYKVNYIDNNTQLVKLSDTAAGLYRTMQFEPAATVEELVPQNVPTEPIRDSLKDQVGRNITGTRRSAPINTTIEDVKVEEYRGGLNITLKGTEGDINFGVYKKTVNGMPAYGFDSTDIPKGGSLGYPLNKAGWDFIKSKGGKYYLDTALTNANPFRLGLNMLRYANERGWDNVDFIHLRENMYGYGANGLSRGTSRTKPLTKENLKQLNKNLINGLVKEKLNLQGVNIKTMPDNELNRILAERLPRNNLSVTPSAVKDLIRFMKEHSPRTMFGITPFLVLFDNNKAEASSVKTPSSPVKDYFAKIESGGRYDAQNEFSGAYGKYQIHPVMMKELGISKAYLQKPENQEKVMDQLLPKYKSRLERFNIPVTKENMFVIHNLGSTGGVRVLTGKYTKEDIKNMSKQLPDELKGDESSIVYNYSNRYNVEIPKRAT